MMPIRLSLAKVLNLCKTGKIILALTAVLLLTGITLAQGTPSVGRWAIGGGGGHAENGGYALDGTVGQAVAGVAGSAPYGLCAGLWCGVGAMALPGGYCIYVPLVMRNL
jgi:hypothetical protein